MRNLIITADDFGKSIPINEAVEEGYKAGIISAASLMVAGDECDDAVKRSSKNKKLGVGLHLTLLDEKPVLSPELLPDLVTTSGSFTMDPIKFGIRLFFSKNMQKQAEIEIEAQLNKFIKTGLTLDHVNSHKHFHMHPKIVKILTKILPKYGNPPVRVPYEPYLKRPDIGYLNSLFRRMKSLFYYSQNYVLKKELRKNSIFSNDKIFGLLDTGNMDEEKLIHILKNLFEETTEIYFHPASEDLIEKNRFPKGYKVLNEKNAVTSTRVKEFMTSNNIFPVSYSRAAQFHLDS